MANSDDPRRLKHLRGPSRGRPQGLRPGAVGAAWLALLSAAGCGGIGTRGPALSVRDAGPAADMTPAADASSAEVPSPWEGFVPDTVPICGKTTSTCAAVPYRAVPGANECDLRTYVNPDDRCWCYCPVDEVGCGAHGRCIRRGQNSPECECNPGFIGAQCDACGNGLTGSDCNEGCGPGTIPTDGGCETFCERESLTCQTNSYCAAAPPATCVCLEGWAEPNCTECAPGYRPEWVYPHTYPAYVTCAPYCEPCAPSRHCDLTLHPPACACRSAYTQVGGDCLWHGTDLGLPTSTEACGDWRFFVLPSEIAGAPPVLDNLTVAVAEGKLVLHVGTCGAIAAGTMVDLPASDTMPGVALRIGFAGTPGGTLFVYVGGSLEEAPAQDLENGWTIAAQLEPVAGGEQVTEVCIPQGAAGDHTGLLLWAGGENNDCSTQQVDLTISELSLVASPSCPSN